MGMHRRRNTLRVVAGAAGLWAMAWALATLWETGARAQASAERALDARAATITLAHGAIIRAGTEPAPSEPAVGLDTLAFIVAKTTNEAMASGAVLGAGAVAFTWLGASGWRAREREER